MGIEIQLLALLTSALNRGEVGGGLMLQSLYLRINSLLISTGLESGWAVNLVVRRH
jgi:hypothetical protein